MFCKMISTQQVGKINKKKGLSGLDKLCTQCTQHARKEVFACIKLCASKSFKTHLSSTQMLSKVASCFFI